jgi:hypothetical protein
MRQMLALQAGVCRPLGFEGDGRQRSFCRCDHWPRMSPWPVAPSPRYKLRVEWWLEGCQREMPRAASDRCETGHQFHGTRWLVRRELVSRVTPV